MKRIDSYLFFDNNCREAMTFYQQCLGGEVFFMTVGESPVAGQMPPGMEDKILHASLTNQDVVLMASDNCMGGSPVVQGQNVSLSLSCSSEEELNGLYAKLSAGGMATVPPKAEFWGDIFGMLTDKYGFNWMLGYRPEQG